MDKHFIDYVLKLTGAKAILKQQPIQSLWSGYGEILKLTLSGGASHSVIAKWVQGESKTQHPRGWHSAVGHQRKLRSYQVESHFYQQYAPQSKARLPQYYGSTKKDGKTLLVLEDLDAAGFPIRLKRLNPTQFKNCLAWLAKWHASFMGVKPDGLWETGTYWHLETRQQEWAALTDENLKASAAALEEKLRSSPFQTLVHGDAKLANFCFAPNNAVAGLDFQYVGGGCGMKDLAYFVGSCLSPVDCEKQEEAILDFYFETLTQNLGTTTNEIETAWRPLYRVAWADFYRFIKGWSPNHRKVNSYSERITQAVLKKL